MSWDGRANTRPRAGDAAAISVPSINTPVTQTVTFANPFPTGTTVTVTCQQRTGSGLVYDAWPTSVSATGFTLNVVRSGGASPVSVYWQAVAV